MRYTLLYMSSEPAMRRTQVYLTEAEYQALKKVSARTGVSFAAILRDAVDAYLERQEGYGVREALVASYGCLGDGEGTGGARDMRRERGERESRFQ